MGAGAERVAPIDGYVDGRLSPVDITLSPVDIRLGSTQLLTTQVLTRQKGISKWRGKPSLTFLFKLVTFTHCLLGTRPSI